MPHSGLIEVCKNFIKKVGLRGSVEIFSRIVVGVHLTAESASSVDAVSHHFICLVVGHVDLEEAGMGLRESVFVHVTHQPNLVLVTQIAQVNWEATTSPNKLEISLTLLVVEGFKDPPEARDDAMVFAVVREPGDSSETVN